MPHTNSISGHHDLVELEAEAVGDLADDWSSWKLCFAAAGGTWELRDLRGKHW